jgi:hypothetical protein
MQQHSCVSCQLVTCRVCNFRELNDDCDGLCKPCYDSCSTCLRCCDKATPFDTPFEEYRNAELCRGCFKSGAPCTVCNKNHMSAYLQQTSCCSKCTLPPCYGCKGATNPKHEASMRGLCHPCSKKPICKICNNIITGTVKEFTYCEPCYSNIPACTSCGSMVYSEVKGAIAGLCRQCDDQLPKCACGNIAIGVAKCTACRTKESSATSSSSTATTATSSGSC